MSGNAVKPMALKAVSSIAKVVTVDHDDQNYDGQLDCCFYDSDDDDDYDNLVLS